MSGLAGIRSFAGDILDPVVTTLQHALSSRRADVSQRAGNVFVLGNDVQTLAERFVVADARLTNRDELIRSLSTDRAASDSELILHAYINWGESCLARLQGDFAFCIIDQDLLFCARDRLGVKPFYFSLDQQQFVFASEAQPVADVIGLRINEQRIADFLLFPMEHADSSSTFYQDVSRLPAATAMVIRGGQQKFNHYWQPDMHIAGELSDQDVVDRFRELTLNAMQERTRDGEFAISLSGGLDSSFLSGLALQTMSVKSFSTVAEDGVACDESDQIRFITADQPLEETLITPSQQDGIDDWLHQQYSALKEPFDLNMLQMLLIYRFAANAGSEVVADGVEGDLTYSLPDGYAASLLKAGNVGAAIRELLGQRHHSYGAPHGLASLVWRTAKRFKPAGLSGRAPLHLGDMIDPDFARTSAAEARWERMSRDFSSLDEAVRYRARHPAITAALERYDRVAAQAGVTPIHPLLDSQLIEFSLSLPWYFRCRDGWDKYLIRASSKGLMPETIRWQTGKPENAWHFNERYFARHQREMRESIAGHRRLLSPYIAKAMLDEPDEQGVWTLYTLGCWLARQID